eukprot:g47617.t1
MSLAPRIVGCVALTALGFWYQRRLVRNFKEDAYQRVMIIIDEEEEQARAKGQDIPELPPYLHHPTSGDLLYSQRAAASQPTAAKMSN